MSDSLELTPAEKRAITKARKAQEAAEEEKRLIAAGAGRRKAKIAAIIKAVWKPGNSDTASKKRGSSPAADDDVDSEPPKAKKARRSKAAPVDDQEPEAVEEPSTTAKRLALSRKHPPARIVDSDDEEVPKETLKAKKPPAPPKPATKAAKSSGKTKKSRPTLVAETASEDSSESASGQSSSEAESDEEDEEDEEDDDDSVASAKLVVERPRIITKQTKTRPVDSDSEMPDVETRHVPGTKDDDDSDEVPSPGHWRTRSASWSSGPGTGVPDTDFEDFLDALEDDENDGMDQDNASSVEVSEAEDKEPVPMVKTVLKPSKRQDSDQEDYVAVTPITQTKPPKDTSGAEDPPPPATVVQKKKPKIIPQSDGEEEDPSRDGSTLKTAPPKKSRQGLAETEAKPPEKHKEPEKPVKKGKQKSVREQKADQEKPNIRSAPAAQPKPKKRGSTKIPETVNFPEEHYHPPARIVFPGHGKDIKLTDQSPELRAVLTGAIVIVRVLCILVDGYPVLVSRPGDGKFVMLKFARGKLAAIHIVERLESDPRMSRWLVNIVVDRLSTVRSDAKKRATAIVPGFYRFAHLDPASVKVLVGDLLEGHKYIFPVIPITGKLDTTQPFRHGAIIKLIKDEWITAKFVKENKKYYKSSREKHPDQFEVPDALLALAANAMFGALSEYQLTGTRQNIKFAESTYEDSYRYHLRTIAGVRADAPNATAILLHKIYTEIHSVENEAVAVGTSTLIKLVEVPDSD